MRKHAPIFYILAATFVAQAPWCGVAFHIDEPLFLWTARHILTEPANPYNFQVNWYGTAQPMPDVFKNPPGAAYFAALVASVFGLGEWPLHLAFLLPALVFIWGTYRLAERFTSTPWLPTALTALAPGFAVSALTVMSDVPMAALALWAVVWWLRGLESGRALHFLWAGALLGLAFLTKYSAILIIPLWVLHALWRKDRRRAWIIAPVFAGSVVFDYELVTRSLYGRGLFWDSVQFSRSFRGGIPISPLELWLEGLVFCGGCALPAALLALGRTPRRLPPAMVLAAVLIGLVILHTPAPSGGVYNTDTSAEWRSWPIAVQGFVFAVLGCLLLVQMAMGTSRPSFDTDPDAGNSPGWSDELFFLAALALTAFLFGTALNWTVNARSLLLILPPSAILVSRNWKMPDNPFKLLWILGPSALIAILCVQGDCAGANAARALADRMKTDIMPHGRRTWSTGAWGFPYYAVLAGAPQFDANTGKLKPEELVVIPSNASSTGMFPLHGWQQVASFPAPESCLISTMDDSTGAAFYGTVWGVLPYSVFPRAQGEMGLVYADQP